MAKARGFRVAKYTGADAEGTSRNQLKSFVVSFQSQPNEPIPWQPSKKAKAKAISRKDQNQSKSRGVKN